MVKALQLEKAFYDLSDFVERVGKLGWIGPVAVAETGIVRRDHMESIRQDSNQITVLMRGGRESMQQHQLRVHGIASLSISNIQSAGQKKEKRPPTRNTAPFCSVWVLEPCAPRKR